MLGMHAPLYAPQTHQTTYLYLLLYSPLTAITKLLTTTTPYYVVLLPSTLTYETVAAAHHRHTAGPPPSPRLHVYVCLGPP